MESIASFFLWFTVINAPNNNDQVTVHLQNMAQQICVPSEQKFDLTYDALGSAEDAVWGTVVVNPISIEWPHPDIADASCRYDIRDVVAKLKPGRYYFAMTVINGSKYGPNNHMFVFHRDTTPMELTTKAPVLSIGIK